MATLSISEAARRVGITRQTMHKHIKSGRVSSTRDNSDQPAIDEAELYRVYGDEFKPVTGGDVAAHVKSIQQVTGNSDRSITGEIDRLQRELTAAAEREAWLRGLVDRQAAQLEQAQRLLESSTTKTEKKQRGFFSWPGWWPGQKEV